MDDEMVERFREDGFVKIEGAFPPRVAEHRARLLWRETGYDPEDPGTWKDPVHWVYDLATGPFAAAVNTPVLHEAFDLLVGEDRRARRGAAARPRSLCPTTSLWDLPPDGREVRPAEAV